jgi:hypothetical protein
MAKAPGAAMSMPPPAADPTGGSADPSMGAAGGDDTSADAGQDTTGSSETCIVSICKAADGSYMVYAGDEPDDSDTSDDDSDAMGGMGGGGAPGGSGSAQGQPASSIGAALKIAMDLLQADKSSEGAPGNADDQFAAGFSASKSPTPAAGPAQKY